MHNSVQGSMDYLLLLLVGWALAAYWLFAIVMMLIEGDLDVFQFALAVLVTLWMGYNSIKPQYPYANLVSAVVLGLACILIPFAKATANKRANAQVDAELALRQIAATEFDPKNFHAWAELARLCYRYGLVGPAMAHMQRGIDIAPQFTFAEKREMERWVKELRGAQPPETIPCMGCGKSCSAGELRCPTCGDYVLPPLLRGKLITAKLGAKLVRAWAVFALGATVLPIAVKFLPAPLALPIALVGAGAALYALYRVLRA